MKYQLANPEDFERLTMFCIRNGVPVPSPETSIVAFAEKDGEIAYVHMAHLQLHLDNQCRDRDFKGYVDFRKVFECIELAIPRPATVYTYPSYENGVRMAEICGFKKVPYPLMMKCYHSGKEN